MRRNLPPLILASASKARAKLLTDLGLKFTVRPSDFVEDMTLGKNESHEDLALRLARGKAKDMDKKLKEGIIIGVDSFAVIEGKMLGKPYTKEKAMQQLTLLSGRTHTFITGIVLIDVAKKKEEVDVTKTYVTFRKITKKEIEQYVEKEDVLPVAGSYRILALGSLFVENISGDFFSVVGISNFKLTVMLKKLGYNIFDYVSA